MSECLVTFDNGKQKLFTGSTFYIIQQVYNFCKKNNLTTVEGKWNPPRKDEKKGSKKNENMV